MSNSIVNPTAKPAPVKTTAAKPAAPKPAAKKQESSSDSSGNDHNPSQSFSTWFDTMAAHIKYFSSCAYLSRFKLRGRGGKEACR